MECPHVEACVKIVQILPKKQSDSDSWTCTGTSHKSQKSVDRHDKAPSPCLVPYNLYDYHYAMQPSPSSSLGLGQLVLFFLEHFYLASL